MADRSYKLTLSLSDGSTINAGTITAPQGPNGANGANGATFTPSVSAAGILSWTNNGGLTNPSPVNIKGPKGDDAIITASDVENWGFTKNKGTVTSVAVKINGTIKGTVTSSGTIDLGTVLTEHQDISGKANLDGGNIFTGKQTLNSPGSDGYSINAAGYVKGSWLQASAIANKGANTGKVCVFDNSGWIYYRTPAEILAEAGGAKASDIPDISGKANLIGGNYFNGFQTIDGDISISKTVSCSDEIAGVNLSACDDGQSGGSPYFSVKYNNGAPTVNLTDGTSLNIDDNPGTSGQVLTSQGAGVTPIWGDVTKHGYTQLTNEDLNTIVEVGWYRAAANNSCTNKPPLAGVNAFVLVTEKGKDTFIKQTVWLYHSSFVVFTDCYCRCTRDSGNSWGDWSTLQMVDHNPQAFYGCKTFSDGISLSGSLEANNSVGTTGQVLTSQGAGNTPIWGDVTKHGYTELTNENLNTITEVGWYRAASGNTCTNRPTNVVGTTPFILEVEKCTSAEIRQTLYTRYWTNGFYIRTSTNSGSSWTSWQSQYTVDTGAQAFSGRKSFTGGINLNSSLQVNSSSGTAGQVLTSTGTGVPQWKTPSGGDSVASVVDLTGSLIGGDAYFPFNNGEEGSFTGMIYCEYNTSAGDFEFQINDQIFSCTPASQDITLRVTIDRFYNGYVYSYYYTIISNDGLINNSGFFTDTNSDMCISTNMGSSYTQYGVGTIITKVV